MRPCRRRVDAWQLGASPPWRTTCGSRTRSVRSLVDDARTWVERATRASDEIGARFHRRLAAVHPFVNGNGRHGRVAADLLVVALGGAAFSWGAGLSVSTDELRRSYRRALVEADHGDLSALLTFART